MNARMVARSVEFETRICNAYRIMKISKDILGEYIDYLSDESRRTGCADSIAFPESETDICDQMRWAAETKTPVTIQSGRTGITGGATPNGGRILNVSRMNHFTGLRYADESARYIIRAQPGCTLKALNDALLAGGTFHSTNWDETSRATLNRYRKDGIHVFPPDLTESGACLGGVVANNGSGARTFHYGAARPHVASLRVVLPGGDILHLQRGVEQALGRSFELTSLSGRRLCGQLPSYSMPEVKNSSGIYAGDNMDLIDLFIGSEGVLGVISEIKISLTPVPDTVWAMTAFLPSEDCALSFVEQVRLGHRRTIAAIEFFSAEALNLLRLRRADNPAFGALPELKDHWHTAVYVEFSGNSEEEVENSLSGACEILEACNGNTDDTWLATGRRDIETFKGVRHAVPEAVNLLISERKKQYPEITKLGTDLAVPDEHLREVMAMYHHDLREAHLEYVIFGHIGNNHLHVNILPSVPDDYVRGEKLYLEWAKRVVEMGGTVSAEHGIGKLKTDMLKIMYGNEAIEQMLSVKKVFDPYMLINRETLFQL